MCQGAYGVHTPCLALSFILGRDFVRMEFVVAVGIRYGGKYHIDSDGFKIHAVVR